MANVVLLNRVRANRAAELGPARLGLAIIGMNKADIKHFKPKASSRGLLSMPSGAELLL